MHRIEAELLIPGHGDPIRDGVVLLDGSPIGYAGPAGVAPQTPGAPVSRAVAVMPGMWECHGHFLGTRTFDLRQLPLEPETLRAARCTRDLRAALDAGITSVREVGGLGIHLARAVAEGIIDGPAIYSAGAILRRRDHRGRRSAGGHRRARRPGPHHRGLDQGPAGQGRRGLAVLYPQGVVYLVVERDAVVADHRDLGLLLPGPVDRARP